ncbi:UNVERIFIED_CONTAM: hypothetical protein K2H54_067125 [Gekko kuhli]
MHTDQCLECLLRQEVYLSYCLRLSIPVQVGIQGDPVKVELFPPIHTNVLTFQFHHLNLGSEDTGESEEVAPEAALEPPTVAGPSHRGQAAASGTAPTNEEQWWAEIKATLEKISKKLDDKEVRTNLLEIGMRRLQRDLEVRRLNESIAAQAAEKSGDEEEDSEEAEDERE